MGPTDQDTLGKSVGADSTFGDEFCPRCRTTRLESDDECWSCMLPFTDLLPPHARSQPVQEILFDNSVVADHPLAISSLYGTKKDPTRKCRGCDAAISPADVSCHFCVLPVARPSEMWVTCPACDTVVLVGEEDCVYCDAPLTEAFWAAVTRSARKGFEDPATKILQEEAGGDEWQ